MIKVLIVEDSQVARDFLTYILSSDPHIHVIGTAKNGEEAVSLVRDKRPDIVTMDIKMPKIDGFEATRIIMETTPTPIVIVSAGWDPKDVEKTFRMMDAGALAVVKKPVGFAHPDYKDQAKELIQMVKLMSEVKVVRRRSQINRRKDIPAGLPVNDLIPLKTDVKVVAIGASTGGPPVLQTILKGLPKDFPVPITVVQHITQGFTTGFASWLSDTTGFIVRVPENAEKCLPGTVYVAPDNAHMVFDNIGRILLNNDPPDNMLKPSVAHLFISAANVFREKAVGVLLTGMGKDGAKELKMMRDMGAVTIAQNEESSAVFGMNGEALKLKAARYVLSPEAISERLVQLLL